MNVKNAILSIFCCFICLMAYAQNSMGNNKQEEKAAQYAKLLNAASAYYPLGSTRSISEQTVVDNLLKVASEKDLSVIRLSVKVAVANHHSKSLLPSVLGLLLPLIFEDGSAAGNGKLLPWTIDKGRLRVPAEYGYMGALRDFYQTFDSLAKTSKRRNLKTLLSQLRH